MKKLYIQAQHIIAVSKGSARDLELTLKLPVQSVKTIYNPIVDDELFERAREKVDHPWFIEKKVPIIISVGRLREQKDYKTLIHSFHLIRLEKPAKLIILGEGDMRGELEELVRKYGLINDVWMPGFVANPFSYISKSDLFVMSSQWEGFGNVLVEALACGCPVVSTDCPHGPYEILSGGKYGILTDPGDYNACARAIKQALNGAVDKMLLVSRASDFTIKIATEKYLELLK